MHPTVRLPGLDTLRALAILAVMLFHLQGYLPEALGPAAHFGWMGVDLFFVLSGYLIGLQLLAPYGAGRTTSILDFYRRRAFRILPAYLVVVAFYFLLPSFRERPGISPLWEFLTFTESLFVDYSHNQAFSHVWSLCVEEHFYLILPLLVALYARRATAAKTACLLALLVVAGCAIRAYVLVHTLRPLGEDDFATAYIERIYYPTWSHLDGLLAGVSIALVKVFRPGWWLRIAAHGHTALASGVALTGVAMWLFYARFDSLYGVAAAGTVVGFPVLSLGLGLVVVAALSQNSWLARWRVPGARLVATLAFSLYLTHKAIVHLVRGWMPGATADRGMLAMAIYVAACGLGAGLLYLAVEAPALRLRGRQAPNPKLDPAL